MLASVARVTANVAGQALVEPRRCLIGHASRPIRHCGLVTGLTTLGERPPRAAAPFSLFFSGGHSMPRFLVTYHGGGMPDSEEGRQQAMAAFAAWVGATGPALVDPGAPLGAFRTVSPGSVTDGAAPGPANGYSVLEAADLDHAVELVRDHPYVGRGGSLQVSEAVAP
jgi:hypothetical protein